MKDIYPTYLLIQDIGSGINFNRKGIRKIIDLAI
jgi:predicted site-specific integrase-resolvase